jgi:sporulation protein YlmC with PRC-barrel domain
MKSPIFITTLAFAGAFAAVVPAAAQVAGATTTTGISIVESTQIAMGWSVKKSLLNKTIYNEMGQKVGKVEDIIISPDKSVSYVIVGAGGFIGMGRHDVAIPVVQIQDQAGKLVMPGATKDMIKSMARFDYTNDHAQRDRFIIAAEQDIGKGQSRLAQLETRAGTAATDVKARIDLEITVLQVDVKSAETKLTELKQAATSRWKEFEAGVSSATARLRQSVKAAKG